MCSELLSHISIKICIISISYQSQESGSLKEIYKWIRIPKYLKGNDTLLPIFCLSEDFLRAINKNLSGRKWGGGGEMGIPGGQISAPGPPPHRLLQNSNDVFLT